MKKVLVTGSGDAGKSTFARRLGKATNIKVVHLDQLYFKPDWVKSSKEDWGAKVAEIISRETWILDGNYSGTMEMRMAACDTVIFLDLPRLICVSRILKRAAVYYRRNRPDMAAGCYERFDAEFVRRVWNYPQQSKPKIEVVLRRFAAEKTIIRLKSKRAVEDFFREIAEQ